MGSFVLAVASTSQLNCCKLEDSQQNNIELNIGFTILMQQDYTVDHHSRAA